ncbi:MAG: tetratricopeptide repeat protein, partial [Planctomycetes bacterium]|nr:tetratricopeptide repeat protein [Planctomycetota bacterium]
MDADSLFEKASAAAERGNYDYAIAIYREILANDPDYNRARIALRGCERRRFDEAGAPVKGTLLGYLKGIVPLVRMLLNRKKADSVIECCEDFLLDCPRAVWILSREADAARKAGRVDLAIYLYEDIRQLKSGHIHALQSLGELYEDKNDVRKAQVYYQEMLRNSPGDTGIEKKIRDLQAVGHMQDTRMEEADSFKEMIRDKAKAAELEKSTRIVRSDEEVDSVMSKLQADIKQDPTNANLVGKLGDLYLHRKRYEDAAKTYKRAQELAPTSFAIRQKIGDLQFKRIELFIDQLEQKAAG